MKSKQEIQDEIEQWCKTKNFNAPYGILTGKHKNKKGIEYLTVTFGRARTLDATVEIYNKNFMLLRMNGKYNQVYKSMDALMDELERI